VALSAALAGVVALAPEARAGDPPCGLIEVRLRPGAAGMQMAVWLEDKAGNFVDTAYVTRLTGQFGLGNRPGAALLKTDFRWPYGRREMVAPVWAHRRGHQYPKVVMGGSCGNAIDAMCMNGSKCGGDCDDTTIKVSSYEPFYCSPSGASKLDAMSCASKGTFSKGAYRPFPAEFSLYPPRADLLAKDFLAAVDSTDYLDFVNQNDLVAVSQATPPAGVDLDPSITWFPQNGLAAGDYVMWVELSAESDFNMAHDHANQADSVNAWDFEGHKFLGQPSILYQVPFRYDDFGGSYVATDYAGYSTWDGSDGAVHPPDNTITTNLPSSGAGRLLDVDDKIDVYRVKVLVGGCGVVAPDMGVAADAGSDAGAGGDAGVPDDGGNGPRDASVVVVPDGGAAHPDLGGVTHPVCNVPLGPDHLTVSATATTLTVSFDTPPGGELPRSFAVRYHESSAPILTDDDFIHAVAAQGASADAPGSSHTVTISGVLAQTSYAVAVRGVSSCNKQSPIASEVVMTAEQKFVQLNGCFVATAAWGSPLEPELEPLRQLRNRYLLGNPAGRLLVATYYGFSPALAAVIAGDEDRRALARAALSPVVRAAARLAGPGPLGR